MAWGLGYPDGRHVPAKTFVDAMARDPMSGDLLKQLFHNPTE